jgi:hypothetical protein
LPFGVLTIVCTWNFAGSALVRNTGVMVELDERDRTLDSIVERTGLIVPPDPTEMSIREMALDFLHARSVRTRRQRCNVGCNEIEELALLHC